MLLCRITQTLLEQKAVILQKWVRAWLERRRYRRAVKAAIPLRRPVRCWRAKKGFKKRKSKARSVEHLQKLNVGMEKKIMQLQHKIIQQVAYYRYWSHPVGLVLVAGRSGTYCNCCGRHIGSLGVLISHEQHVCPPSPCSIRK